jgi:hypothetical protein
MTKFGRQLSNKIYASWQLPAKFWHLSFHVFMLCSILFIIEHPNRGAQIHSHNNGLASTADNTPGGGGRQFIWVGDFYMQ